MFDSISQTIEGYNEQVKKIISLERDFPGQEITIGLTLFNQSVHTLYMGATSNEATFLTKQNYQPEGNTALYDAIGVTVHQLENLVERSEMLMPTTVAVIIITDGMENASGLFNLKMIQQTISRLEKTEKWTFSFLGAELQSLEAAKMMNFKNSNTKLFFKENMAQTFDDLKDAMEIYQVNKLHGLSLKNYFKK
jgi:hypothetical protein